MLTMLWKLFPMLALAGMTAAGGPSMKAQIAKFTDMTKVTATQSEMASFSQIIYTTYYVPDEHLPAPEAIPDILRQNMNAPGNRDITKDMWGTPFAYSAVIENGQEVAFIFLSAGPDKMFQTDDDIQFKQKLVNTGHDATPDILKEDSRIILPQNLITEFC